MQISQNPLLFVPLFLFKWVSEYMLVRVGLTDCVNVCACVSSSRVRGAGSVCIEFLSMFGRPLAPRPAGPSSPSPRAPTPSLSRSSSFNLPYSLVPHVASCILHDQVLYLDLCKCHSHKYQYMFCSIFSNILLLTFQNSLSITQQKDKQETHS